MTARMIHIFAALLLLPAVASMAQAQQLRRPLGHHHHGRHGTGRHSGVERPARLRMIQNQSAGSLWVSETATAIAGPPSILIPAGQQFLCMSPASGQVYSIIGATTAQAFAAREW